jgi:FtsP/CotA-like multicopper oxidase with cupredoxin domain
MLLSNTGPNAVLAQDGMMAMDNPCNAAGMMMGGDMDGATMTTPAPKDSAHLGADLDGDGDPDEITFCLQILEIDQEIAPGITIPFWVFAPDIGGMTPPARLPGPTLRVEQGDHVRIVVKNGHYFPHTLHMHGVLKPNAMDGVPDVTQPAILGGESFTYEFTAQNPGTQWYHCHVQTPMHLLMGLYGMLIIEPDRPNNHFQAFVNTAQMPDISAATQEQGFSQEHVLIYSDVDPDLHAPLSDSSNTPAELEWLIHRNYNTVERTPRYFLVNGRSFPLTILDSMIEVDPDSHIKLRLLNAGSRVVSLHLHGHKANVIAKDGVDIPAAQQIPQDTITITPGQRVDLDFNTHADGVHASGPGVWLMHDHTEQAMTTNGINPGGDLNFIAYRDFIDVYGLPIVTGELATYFDPAYYRGDQSVFQGKPFKNRPPTEAASSSSRLMPVYMMMGVLATVAAALGWWLAGLIK